MADNQKDLPPLPDTVDKPLRDTLNRWREAIQVLRANRGDPLDAAVTWRDAVDTGIVAQRGSGFKAVASSGAGSPGTSGPPGPPGPSYTPDLTPPPQPAALAVTPGLTNVIVTFTAPTYTTGHGNQRTDIYAVKRDPASSAPMPTFSDAAVVDSVAGTSPIIAIASDLNVEWHVWAKFVSVDGVTSTTPAGGTNGVVATTGKIGNADLNALIIQAGNLANSAVTSTKLAANSIAVGTAAIQNGAIVNAMVGTAAIDDAKIANVAAGKLTAGAIAVGEYIQSSGFVTGSTGWKINGNGGAEFSFAMVRGTLQAGQIAAGYVIASMVDSRGLSIKDSSGNVILSAGKPLAAQIFTGSGNLYKNSDFTVSSSGQPTYFYNYNNTPITFTQSVNAGGPVGTSNYWRLTATSTATGNFGFFFSGNISSGTPGWSGFQPNTDYVWSFYARAGAGSTILGSLMDTAWNHGPASQTWLSNPGLTTSWQRYAITLNFGSNTIDVNGFIHTVAFISSGDVLDFACNQLETGQSPSGWAPLMYVDSNGILQSAGSATGLAIDNNLLTSAIGDKLSKSTTSILSSTVSISATAGAGFVAGTLTWNSAGARLAGSGVAMTPGGFLGVNAAGQTTFSIDASTGNAIFAGTLAVGTASKGAATGTGSSAAANASSTVSVPTSNIVLLTYTTSGSDALVTMSVTVSLMANTSTPARVYFVPLLDGSVYGTQFPEVELGLVQSNPMQFAVGSGATAYNWGMTHTFTYTFVVSGSSLPSGTHTFGCQVTGYFFTGSGTPNIITGSSIYAKGTATIREFIA